IQNSLHLQLLLVQGNVETSSNSGDGWGNQGDSAMYNDNLVGNSKLATIVYSTPGISILNNGLVMISKIKMHSEFKWQYLAPCSSSSIVH
ncbi:hypothetical protein CMV_025332, partial [Castanea mollissima]